MITKERAVHSAMNSVNINSSNCEDICYGPCESLKHVVESKYKGDIEDFLYNEFNVIDEYGVLHMKWEDDTDGKIRRLSYDLGEKGIDY